MDAARTDVTRANLVELYRESTGLVVDVHATKVWSDTPRLVIGVNEKKWHSKRVARRRLS
jgi:hypothetical protein